MTKKVILTGGAGFIGSCMLRTLNDRGIEDIYVVDNIAKTEKWRNLCNKRYTEYINKSEFLHRLSGKEFDDVDAVIHMGACSSTTQVDFDYLYQNNTDYTRKLWNYCTENEVPFFYASSAATYGDGSNGFNDGVGNVEGLIPLNAYGYSKQLFDLWMIKETIKPPQCVGLKFFNVYGPNEYCKGSMASMIFHGFNQIKENGKIRLFRSENTDFVDGAQERDFVYVKDVCDVIMYFFEHREYSGIFNVGTGRAQTFAEMAGATFRAIGLDENIEYIEMPDRLKKNYQYHTRANITALRKVGYKKEFCDLEKGAEDYVKNYLAREFAIY